MTELKTKENEASVEKFINSVEDEQKRKDSFEIIKLMEKVTGQKPKMWGASIVGFGSYHYKYASGREGDWMKVGFSPRKANLSLYVLSQDEKEKDLLSQLGKHKMGKGCLYINKLEDVDSKILEELIRNTYSGKAQGEV